MSIKKSFLAGYNLFLLSQGLSFTDAQQHLMKIFEEFLLSLSAILRTNFRVKTTLLNFHDRLTVLSSEQKIVAFELLFSSPKQPFRICLAEIRASYVYQDIYYLYIL